MLQVYLAQFCDSHDFTEYIDEVEDVTEPVFEHGKDVLVHLDKDEVITIEKNAREKGVTEFDLLRGWTRKKLHITWKQLKIDNRIFVFLFLLSKFCRAAYETAEWPALLSRDKKRLAELALFSCQRVSRPCFKCH